VLVPLRYLEEAELNGIATMRASWNADETRLVSPPRATLTCLARGATQGRSHDTTAQQRCVAGAGRTAGPRRGGRTLRVDRSTGWFRQGEEGKMDDISSQYKGYVLAAGLGAVAGGLVVALATRAVPKMMSRLMAGMMAQMAESGCDPSDM
jgi:hypothetical protein